MDPTLAVTAVPLPPGSRATTFYRSPNLADAYAVRLPDGATHDPERLARFMFATQAPGARTVDRFMAVPATANRPAYAQMFLWTFPRVR